MKMILLQPFLLPLSCSVYRLDLMPKEQQMLDIQSTIVALCHTVARVKGIVTLTDMTGPSLSSVSIRDVSAVGEGSAT